MFTKRIQHFIYISSDKKRRIIHQHLHDTFLYLIFCAQTSTNVTVQTTPLRRSVHALMRTLATTHRAPLAACARTAGEASHVPPIWTTAIGRNASTERHVSISSTTIIALVPSVILVSLTICVLMGQNIWDRMKKED